MLPLFYFGPISYWIELVKHDQFSPNLDVSIPKKSYVNRCIIATANGPKVLSIPIKGGRGTNQLYEDIEISYAENWISKHKMALKSAYSKSPFYEFYVDRIEKELNKKYSHLHSLNLNLVETIASILKHPLEINALSRGEASDFNQFCPSKPSIIPEYPQVFRNKFEFHSDLCILDLIFNLGNHSRDYLLQV